MLERDYARIHVEVDPHGRMLGPSGLPDIVVHNYRWRLGLVVGETKYDELEKRLATGLTIAVPTITLEGDANGASHPDPSSYAQKFTSRYQRRQLEGGIGHNLPQEAPRAFAKAIIDAAGV